MGQRLVKKELRLGTRSSLLALQQANWVKTCLEGANPQVEVTLVQIKTTGDQIDVPLFQVGGKGLFVKEIEEALLQGEVDLAVHSAKDLPALIPEGLALIAFPERTDPRDALISGDRRGWREIPPGGRVGTGSLRRKAQLLNLRPDLEIVPLRGNLDTRLKKLTSLQLNAVVLASAGLRRLGWAERISEYLPFEVMLPAVGQGTLAIEGRKGDEEIRQFTAFLNDRRTQTAVIAERAFLKKLGGGCQIPVAGLAQVAEGRVSFRALVASLDGRKVIRGQVEGTEKQASDLGEKLAEELLAKGGKEILEEVYAKE